MLETFHITIFWPHHTAFKFAPRPGGEKMRPVFMQVYENCTEVESSGNVLHFKDADGKKHRTSLFFLIEQE
jgi:hypothetical protein